MTHRDRTLAVLRYQTYDRLPIVHFGYWKPLLEKWVAEGHISRAEADGFRDGSAIDVALSTRLGFDFNWQSMFNPASSLRPAFKTETLRQLPDGSEHVRNSHGVVVLQKAGAGSIPAEIEHLLTDRASWEEHYRWRLQWTPERVTLAGVALDGGVRRFGEGGLEALRTGERERPLGLHCGSLFGFTRNLLGVQGASYMMMEDPDLFREIVDACAEVCYQNVRYALEAGARFDFAHYWEDICFAHGPLIPPAIFEEVVGPHYRRINDLVRAHGIDIVSLDCDGKIDALIPTWFANGVNTMFPIEVGTWHASLAPWRAQYGRDLRGVGGMNKNIFARDRAAIDAEIDRLRPIIELGGFIPCPDHRIPPDAQWDLIRYYCDRLRQIYG